VVAVDLTVRALTTLEKRVVTAAVVAGDMERPISARAELAGKATMAVTETQEVPQAVAV
jgi:hypothetical protein